MVIKRRVKTLARLLQSYLADYNFRFAPAVYARLARKDRSAIPLTIDVAKGDVDSSLKSTLEVLARDFQHVDFAIPLSPEERNRANETLERHLGFRLTRGPSTIAGCGKGVFVKRGRVPPRSVVAIYPGTIYDPWDSILLQSIGNHFILRCQDGTIIDGNDIRLSRRVHRSCAFRDLAPNVSDLTWLEGEPFNFLNMGQYINNEPAPGAHNVQYFDLDIHNWPQRLRKFLPFVAYSPHRMAPLRVVVLISVREVVEGEELFSAYISK
ncbi:unnamed protein product [Nippostrongylus brasiliensis]|uniref:SET domain-containing protein n=1 Tax=Nippostrongylus brasiliensis TaxID=27835 RepID=A0A0N4YGF6_NIPBR|nr:hypothetical protein Q1695_015007 [Nippostrongylus brasiliensis]VDL79486.1 unnamed protein product [Nippostrongylus brasiliensis]